MDGPPAAAAPGRAGGVGEQCYRQVAGTISTLRAFGVMPKSSFFLASQASSPAASSTSRPSRLHHALSRHGGPQCNTKPSGDLAMWTAVAPEAVRTRRIQTIRPAYRPKFVPRFLH